MHRNTFVDAPRLLDATLAVRAHPRLRIAGQLAGTEGYLEAAATGLMVALGIASQRAGSQPLVLPRTTAIGALLAWATDPDTDDYQPMHVNFGIVPALAERVRGKRERYAAYARRARQDLASALHPDSWDVGAIRSVTLAAVSDASSRLPSALEHVIGGASAGPASARRPLSGPRSERTS